MPRRPTFLGGPSRVADQETHLAIANAPLLPTFLRLRGRAQERPSSMGQARYAAGTTSSASGFVPHGERTDKQIRAIRGGVRALGQGRQERAPSDYSAGNGTGLAQARGKRATEALEHVPFLRNRNVRTGVHFAGTCASYPGRLLLSSLSCVSASRNQTCAIWIRMMRVFSFSLVCAISRHSCAKRR
jgi:hypothetical protein